MSHDARSVANVMIQKGIKDRNPLTPQQVLKLTYLCQAWMLTLFDRDLFSQEIHVWEHGPIIADVYNSLSKYGDEPIKKQIKGFPTNEFDAHQIHIMNEVYDIYGRWTGRQLSRMTHMPGTPWFTTRKEYPLGRDHTIPKKRLKDYYGAKYREHQSESAT